MQHLPQLSAALLVLLVISLVAVRAQVFQRGQYADCPRPAAVDGRIDMSRFLGRWYVVQKSRTTVRCLVYQISAVSDGDDDENDDEFRIEQITRFTPQNETYQLTNVGRLWRGLDGRFSIKFPMSKYADTRRYAVLRHNITSTFMRDV